MVAAGRAALAPSGRRAALLEVESPGAVARCTFRAPPAPWPSVPVGREVGGLSQGHGDGHPLVALPLTQPSLTPPLGGSHSSVCAMHRHDDH